MAKKRTENWLLLIVPVLGLIPVVLIGLWGYLNFTATILHPNPDDVPSRTGTAPATWAGAIREAQEIVRARLTEENLPGMSVAVGVGSELVWAEGFGWADLENREPITPATTFRIGTASTVLTSAAAGALIEDGRLRLDADIQEYVPEFPRKEFPVTLRQLMGHVAGVRNDGGDEGPLFSRQCERPIDALDVFADSRLLFEPGTDFRFSSYGWILISAAIEAASREPFIAFAQRMFERLNMNDTSAERPDAPMANRATSYFPRFGADPTYGLHLMRPINYSCYSGASVFLSTPSDLVRFGMAVNGGTLLQRATVDLLQTPLRLASGEETGYGLGWDLGDVTLAGEPTRWIGHDGTSLGGPVASFMTFPERELVVAVISNTSYSESEAAALEITEAFALQP